MPMRLIAIGENGQPADDVLLPDIALAVCEATAEMYQKSGFLRPWIGYLAEQDGQVLGTCAFKTAPQEHSVEIAYFTFPEHEGGGIATEMARKLVEIARQSDVTLTITAQTLPQENASTAILRKLGFMRNGTAHDLEAGEVWVWKRKS